MTSNKTFAVSVGLLALAISTLAQAQRVSTSGGFKISSEDGNFEAQLGGRLHYDGNLIDGDAGAPSDDRISDTFFRRARLTLSGRAFGWEYKFEQEFADTPVSERDLFIARQIGPGKLILGQFKHFNGLEEMISSNELLFMERPYVQANLFGNQQFALGAGYRGEVGPMTYAASVQNRKVQNNGQGSNEDLLSSLRLTWAPVMETGSVIHLGVSALFENNNTPNAMGQDLGGAVNVQYAGRNLGSVTLANNYNDASHVGLELATVQGPIYVQGEVALSSLDFLAGTPSQDVLAYYVQASYNLAGLAKPYRGGVFRSVTPGSQGALELKARYEYAENRDIADAELSTISFGANYYVNANVRFMLDYLIGDRKAGTGAVDEPKVLAARAQFVF
jgi:phosphate-selective porin OprO and OprP